jgi:hypothetical protein
MDKFLIEVPHDAEKVACARTKEEARAILPPAYRSQATIVKLNKFSLDQIDEVLSQHEH